LLTFIDAQARVSRADHARFGLDASRTRDEDARKMNRATYGLSAAFVLGTSMLVASACSDSTSTATPVDAGSVDDVTTDDGGVDAAPDAPTGCAVMGLPGATWSMGPYGAHRGDVSADFQLPLTDGTTWSLKDHFDGCESYVFITDRQLQSSTSTKTIWESDADLGTLVRLSPPNVHYFFLSVRGTDAAAMANISAVDGRVTALIGRLTGADADRWRTHLHVVSQRAGALPAWFAGPAATYLQNGFSIDPRQRVHSVGTFADVARPDSASGWFGNNVAYAAYEALYLNAQAIQLAKADAEHARIVTLFGPGLPSTDAKGMPSTSNTLSQYAEADAMLPSAADIASFDTLEVEVTQQCPQADVNELSMNCGAWDYIAFLSVVTGSAGDAGVEAGVEAGVADAGADAEGGAPPPPPVPTTEIARFITSYHRETHWIVDATPMLALFKDGGARHFHWEFAPSWNVQPTTTVVTLRFSNQKKGYRPTTLVPLFQGGAFNSHYDDNRTPVSAMIPASAKRVDLWAVISGHGGDMTTNCAEFCDHQHQFTVGSTVYKKDYPMAGSETGCVADTANGMTPNQGGTWWYGRGGWCPGAPVIPWDNDVTKDAPAGASVSVSYRGLYGNATPPDGSGNIDMNSYLVVYE
jgi:hypothetical protein